jgi:hypothetical protein
LIDDIYFRKYSQLKLGFEIVNRTLALLFTIRKKNPGSDVGFIWVKPRHLLRDGIELRSPTLSDLNYFTPSISLFKPYPLVQVLYIGPNQPPCDIQNPSLVGQYKPVEEHITDVGD